MDAYFSIVSFLVSSSHDDETFVEENRWFGGGAIVESVPTRQVPITVDWSKYHTAVEAVQ